jgi:hypothetical protein
MRDMRNERSPAYPYVNYICEDHRHQDNYYGLGKLELGTLMILQGFCAGVKAPMTESQFQGMAKDAADLAKLGLEAANNLIL